MYYTDSTAQKLKKKKKNSKVNFILWKYQTYWQKVRTSIEFFLTVLSLIIFWREPAGLVYFVEGGWDGHAGGGVFLFC